MEKILIKNNKDFIDWKKKSSDYLGNLAGRFYDEDSPKSYPCVLVEYWDYDKDSYCDLYYSFIYLTDFD